MNMVIRIPLREWMNDALTSTANSNHVFPKFTPFGKTIKCQLPFIGCVLCPRHCDRSRTYILIPAKPHGVELLFMFSEDKGLTQGHSTAVEEQLEDWNLGPSVSTAHSHLYPLVSTLKLSPLYLIFTKQIKHVTIYRLHNNSHLHLTFTVYQLTNGP